MNKKVIASFYIDFDDDFKMHNGECFFNKKYSLELTNDKDIHNKILNELKIDLSRDKFKQSNKNPEHLIETIDNYLKKFNILKDKNINYGGNWEFELDIEEI